jgi:hypothetical protein
MVHACVRASVLGGAPLRVQQGVRQLANLPFLKYDSQQRRAKTDSVVNPLTSRVTTGDCCTSNMSAEAVIKIEPTNATWTLDICQRAMPKDSSLETRISLSI